MATLVIKNVDYPFLYAVKRAAAEAQMAQRDWLIKILTEVMNEPKRVPKRIKDGVSSGAAAKDRVGKKRSRDGAGKGDI